MEKKPVEKKLANVWFMIKKSEERRYHEEYV